MYGQELLTSHAQGSLTTGGRGDLRLPEEGFTLSTTSPTHLSPPTVAQARIAALKVLALALLKQVDSLEREIAADNVSELNLQQEVHRFEAALIRRALAKTGGRQRRAARLLGVKVTTLNTKIKRHKIRLDQATE
jgi:DNA-binding NtrC family response regulator